MPRRTFTPQRTGNACNTVSACAALNRRSPTTKRARHCFPTLALASSQQTGNPGPVLQASQTPSSRKALFALRVGVVRRSVRVWPSAGTSLRQLPASSALRARQLKASWCAMSCSQPLLPAPQTHMFIVAHVSQFMRRLTRRSSRPPSAAAELQR